jgi:hypothetical protein
MEYHRTKKVRQGFIFVIFQSVSRAKTANTVNTEIPPLTRHHLIILPRDSAYRMQFENVLLNNPRVNKILDQIIHNLRTLHQVLMLFTVTVADKTENNKYNNK